MLTVTAFPHSRKQNTSHFRLVLQAEGGGYAAGCSIPDPSINNPTYIIYNPTSNTLAGDVPFAPLAAAWPINLYPFLAVLPNSGSVLVITGTSIGAYVIGPTGYSADAAWGAPARLPVPVNYPQTATIILLPLDAASNWAPQVITGMYAVTPSLSLSSLFAHLFVRMPR